MKAVRSLSLFFCLSFFLICFLIPAACLFLHGISSESFWDTTTLAVVRFTLFQATLSTLISLVIGVPFGLWIRTSESAKFLLRIPFAVPTVVAGIAWIFLLGRSGLLGALNLSYSWKALVLANVFFNIPWIALLTAHARNQIPEIELAAAKVLGASPSKLLTSILLPRLKWAILSAASQVFNFCVMSFALVLLLGGGPPVETLETSIYSSLRFGVSDISSAVAFGLWQILLSLPPWALILWAQSRARIFVSPTRDYRHSFELSAFSRVCMLSMAAVFVVPYFLPILSLNFSALNWDSALTHSLLLSVELASCTALASTALAVLWILNANRSSRIVSTLATLPGSFSILALGLGFYFSYSKWINPFDGSFVCLVILQTLVFLPIAFRWLWPVSLEHQHSIFEAAKTLGASPTHAFFVADWPHWKRPLLSITAMIAGASMGEVAAVSLFYSEKTMPISVLIGRFAQKYRFEEAQDLSYILLFLSVGAVLLGSGGKFRKLAD